MTNPNWEEEFDEDGNLIITDPDGAGGEWGSDDIDYKSEYEKEKAKREKAEINRNKMAKQLNDFKANPNTVDEETTSKIVQQEMFFTNDPIAKEFRKEIKEIQTRTNMSAEDARDFYLAKNKPELLIKTDPEWTEWTPAPNKSDKVVGDMSFEELRPEKTEKGKTSY